VAFISLAALPLATAMAVQSYVVGYDAWPAERTSGHGHAQAAAVLFTHVADAPNMLPPIGQSMVQKRKT